MHETGSAFILVVIELALQRSVHPNIDAILKRKVFARENDVDIQNITTEVCCFFVISLLSRGNPSTYFDLEGEIARWWLFDRSKTSDLLFRLRFWFDNLIWFIGRVCVFFVIWIDNDVWFLVVWGHRIWLLVIWIDDIFWLSIVWVLDHWLNNVWVVNYRFTISWTLDDLWFTWSLISCFFLFVVSHDGRLLVTFFFFSFLDDFFRTWLLNIFWAFFRLGIIRTTCFVLTSRCRSSCILYWLILSAAVSVPSILKLAAIERILSVSFAPLIEIIPNRMTVLVPWQQFLQTPAAILAIATLTARLCRFGITQGPKVHPHSGTRSDRCHRRRMQKGLHHIL